MNYYLHLSLILCTNKSHKFLSFVLYKKINFSYSSHKLKSKSKFMVKLITCKEYLRNQVGIRFGSWAHLNFSHPKVECNLFRKNDLSRQINRRLNPTATIRSLSIRTKHSKLRNPRRWGRLPI